MKKVSNAPPALDFPGRIDRLLLQIFFGRTLAESVQAALGLADGICSAHDDDGERGWRGNSSATVTIGDLTIGVGHDVRDGPDYLSWEVWHPAVPGSFDLVTLLNAMTGIDAGQWRWKKQARLIREQLPQLQQWFAPANRRATVQRYFHGCRIALARQRYGAENMTNFAVSLDCKEQALLAKLDAAAGIGQEPAAHGGLAAEHPGNDS